MNFSLPPFLAAAVLLAGCTRAEPPGKVAAGAQPPIKARVVTVRSESVPQLTEITGTVHPIQRAQLAAKVMGTITEMPIALGQRVKSGEVLVKISAAEISARVAQAQSQLNQIRRDLDRERDLLPKGASTADMVRGLEDRHAAAQAMLHEAEVMQGYTLLRAPFDGVIARKLANTGDLASPGSTLLELEGTAGFEVEAGVPDSLVPSLALGTAFRVELPGSGTAFDGKLAELSSAADAHARTVTIKIAVPANVAVRSGEFARVHVPGPAVRTLLAPAAAVFAFGQMERMFVATNDNRAVLRLVKTGARRAERVEILSGLDDGERVVVGAPAGLQEGQLIAIEP